MRFFTLIVINLLVMLSFSVLAQNPQTLVPIDPAINEVFQLISSNEKVRGSLQLIEETEPENVREQFRITEITQPPFL